MSGHNSSESRLAAEPPLILVPIDNCIWKVVQIETWENENLQIGEFNSSFEMIDVRRLGLVWVYGPPFSFRSETLWVEPWGYAPLNAMQVIALAASDEFPMEKALRLR